MSERKARNVSEIIISMLSSVLNAIDNYLKSLVILGHSVHLTLRTED